MLEVSRFVYLKVFESMVLLCALFSVSRLFWSTVDPRRRSVYTCRIVEVVPKAVASSLPVVIEDMTILHDVNDPNYDPVRAANYCSRTRHKSADEDTVSVSEDECLSDTGSADDLTDLTSTDPDHSKYDCIRTDDACSASLIVPPSQLWASLARPAFSRSAGLQYDHGLPSGVLPWKEQNVRTSPSLNKSGISNTSRKVNDNDCSVSGLSEDTLRLLGISSASHNVTKGCQRAAVIAEPLTAGGDDLLLSMACRLNEAAARSSRSKTRLRNTGVTDQKMGSGDGGQQSSGNLLTSGNESCQPSRTFVHESDECSRGLTSVMQTDGPPYITDSDHESDNLRLVADFSTDEEQAADDLDEEKLRSKLVSASLRGDAEMCGSSASCVNENSVFDSPDKIQEKPHVVLHDILKAGISIQDGVCHLNFEQGKTVKNCALMRKSPLGLAGKLEEQENPSIMGSGSVPKSAALLNKVAGTPAGEPVTVSQQTAFSVCRRSYENDVDKLISDIVSCSSAEPHEVKSSNSNIVKLDSDSCMTRRAVPRSSQSFTGPTASTLVLKTSDQKVSCTKIPRVSAAADRYIAQEDAAASCLPVSKVKSGLFSQLMMEPRVTFGHSSTPSEQMKRPYVRLTSLPQEVCRNTRTVVQEAPVSFTDAASGISRTSPVTADPDCGTLSYVGEVPLNVDALQASVRPVCSSFSSTSAAETDTQERLLTSLETLEHLLANAKQQPYFIRVSADETTSELGTSLGGQECLRARPVDKTPLDASRSTGSIAERLSQARRRPSVRFAEDADVATKKMSVNSNYVGNNNRDNCTSNLNKAAVITSNVLKDASNQPLGPPKRKLRVKLKDRSSIKSTLGLLDFLFWYYH